MKKSLFMAMIVALLSACSKDDDVKVTYAAAEDIVGTWTFQNPLWSYIVVKGSDKETVDDLKLCLKFPTGKPYLNTKFTFNADKTCDVIESIDNENLVGKGTYRVENGRLYFKYKDSNGDETPLNIGLLEKRNKSIYFVWDKQSLIEQTNDLIARPTDVTDSERKAYKDQVKVLTEKITEVSVPFEMVKN
jgi:hypothetical protein